MSWGFGGAKQPSYSARHRLWRALKGASKPELFSAAALHRLVAASSLFDTEWYLDRYPDVAIAGADPIAHYLDFGASEGRDPNPLFDSSWYLEHNSDVAEIGINPLVHYIRYGANEGRSPSAVFNGELYRKWNANIPPRVNPLGHCLRQRRNAATRSKEPRPAAAHRHLPLEDFYDASSNYARAQTLLMTKPRRKTWHYTPGLSIIILNLDKPELIIPLVEDLKKAREAYFEEGNLEVIIGDTGSRSLEVLKFYDGLPVFVRVIRNLDYHFSRSNNDCFFSSVRHDKVLFLNNDVIIKNNTQCINDMALELTRDPQAGCVGLCLFYGNQALQHGGIDFFSAGDLRGFCYHPRAGETLKLPRGSWHAPAVTGACLMVSSFVFAELGGFDEEYLKEAQDVDLCLKLLKIGKHNTILNCGNIIHLENATRPKGEENWQDRRKFMRRWSSFVEAAFL